MHGIGLDEDVRSWFDMNVPKPRVARHVHRTGRQRALSGGAGRRRRVSITAAKARMASACSMPGAGAQRRRAERVAQAAQRHAGAHRQHRREA